jgi:small conductance mechanosensitive channel
MDTNESPLTVFFENTEAARFWHDSSRGSHVLIIVGIALLVHFLVRIIRNISEWFIIEANAKKNPLGFVTQQPKFITLTRLIVSAATFVIYFVAIGFVLVEGFHFDLTAYFASATIIGLAISFGSQNLVQDVVTGVTLIFSNAIDVGDLVDLGGVIGRVDSIGLRFTKLVNFYNQEIFVPNRNITNVSRFPRGGIYAYADIQVPRQADQATIARTIEQTAHGIWMQFQAIVLARPEVGKIQVADPAGWNFMRVKFTIWPGQGSIIENTFCQQMTSVMKTFEPNYASWMVTVTYRAMDLPQPEAKPEPPLTPAPPP